MRGVELVMCVRANLARLGDAPIWCIREAREWSHAKSTNSVCWRNGASGEAQGSFRTGTAKSRAAARRICGSHSGRYFHASAAEQFRLGCVNRRAHRDPGCAFNFAALFPWGLDSQKLNLTFLAPPMMPAAAPPPPLTSSAAPRPAGIVPARFLRQWLNYTIALQLT